MADPTRYRLLWALSRRELPVGSLAELLGAHVAAVSQHLAKLRAAGLVESRREGTRIIYRAAGPHVRGLLEEASLVAAAGVAGAALSGSGGRAAVAAAPAEVAEPAEPAGVAKEQSGRAAGPLRARRPAAGQ
ncbi:ArsR/SmtB family transcription factor [Streptacidiphilus sp. N1-12]|uniref:ArsR/SmtB family transcription factor n=2 Tax=Streptacidiphilus alkalitolerans TaxID=3342712 RepID=A0ABV6WMA7_9ACTN